MVYERLAGLPTILARPDEGSPVHPVALILFFGTALLFFVRSRREPGRPSRSSPEHPRAGGSRREDPLTTFPNRVK